MTRLPRAAAAILFLGIVVGILGPTAPDRALAQPTGIMPDGAAAATGFSGAEAPTIIAPGANPADKTYIDLNGPSLRVIDLQAPGGAAQGQLIQATKPFTATAGQIGQVFGVALDNATPPNIYVAATSVYGLPIVVPPAGGAGEPARAQQGGPNAQFMPGLFGPQAQQGGPGSIWRIDGASGAVSLFANVTLDGVANSGPALGGLAFDPASKSLFVADRETGMIHRFDMTGAERGRYDHGTQGRQAAGQPPVPFDQATRLNIASPQFQPGNPQTWGYAPPSRRIFALAVREGRLLYSVAENLQIWSVAITPDGSFGTDARMELAVPPGQGPSEISKITFDDQGRMLLAERLAPSGAYDFVALAGQGGRVLRYAAPSAGGPPPAPEEYAVGFAGATSNGNGGVAVGYGYDANGRLDRNACGGFVWMSGEQLRVAAEPGLAASLAQGGSPNVNGLQGNGIDAVRPANAPPTQSYFVDFDNRFEDPDARGHMGDVAILRQCAGGPPAGPGPGGPGGPGGPEGPPSGPPSEQPFGPGPEQLTELWEEWPLPPPPVCPIGTHPEPNGLQCCLAGQIPGVNGVCQSACSNGDPDPAHGEACYHGWQGPGPSLGVHGTCWNGSTPVHISTPFCNAMGPWHWGWGCNKCPKAPLKQCPSGQHFVAGAPPAGDWEWSNGHCVDNVPGPACPAGQQKNQAGVCQNLCPGGGTAYPVNRCCVNGTHVNALGQCPGVIAPPLWYLDFLATGTGPCLLPDGNCSFFEFTITGRQRFGRGSLTQRITLPAGSNFPEARITRGAKFCPPSAWTCSKSGDGFVCTAEDCGLSPGEQVVLRLEGRVVPELTQPPPTTIMKTACGTLEWQAVPGPGPVTMVQPGAGAAAVGTETQPSREPGGEISRLLTPSRQACWTIPVLGRTTQPTCARNYVPTRDGQCCLASQMTKRGVCCPAGQRPDARGEQCVGQFVPVIPQRETCGPDQTGVWPNCCPIGQYWDGKRCITPPPRQCPPDSIGTPPECRCRPPLIGIPGSCVERPCPLGQHRVRGTCVPDIGIVTCPAGQHPVGRICVPDVGPCPQGQHRVGRTCVPNVVICPRGKHRVGDTCVPNVIICPRGKHRVGDTCVPNIIVCPRGQHRVGDTCVPMRLELRQKPPQLQLRRTQPQFQLKQPLRRTGPGPY